jgi:hypothetical protein
VLPNGEESNCMPLSNDGNWGSTSDVDDNINSKTNGWERLIFNSHEGWPNLWNSWDSSNWQSSEPMRPVCGMLKATEPPMCDGWYMAPSSWQSQCKPACESDCHTTSVQEIRAAIDPRVIFRGFFDGESMNSGYRMACFWFPGDSGVMWNTAPASNPVQVASALGLSLEGCGGDWCQGVGYDLTSTNVLQGNHNGDGYCTDFWHTGPGCSGQCTQAPCHDVTEGQNFCLRADEIRNAPNSPYFGR